MSTNPYSLVDGLNADAREIRQAFDEYEARITQLRTDLRLAQTAHLAAEELLGNVRESKEDAELKIANATRRADTAERLMREAQRRLDAGVANSLGDAVSHINDVMTRVTEALLGAGSGIKAGAEVRRQMAVKYSLEHDAEHGEEMFLDAATALIQNDVVYWPEEFGKRTFERLAALPQRARAHAIALIAVAYDISLKEQDDA